MATLFIVPSTGQACEVDEDVYQWAINHNWYLKCGYPTRYVRLGIREWTEIALHREIMGDPPGMEVHHENENRLDCRRENLKVLTPCEHRQRHPGRHKPEERKKWPPYRNNRSGYKGVTFHKANGTWMVQLRVGGKTFVLGYHDTPEEAAVVYDAGVLAYRSPTDFTNLIEISEPG